MKSPVPWKQCAICKIISKSTQVVNPWCLSCCSGQWSAMVSAEMCTIIHDREERVEIWTESRCLADVEMFQLILLKACRMMGSTWVSFPYASFNTQKAWMLNCSWNPNPPSQLQASEWDTGENLAAPSATDLWHPTVVIRHFMLDTDNQRATELK